jgi:hypothetical protein
MNDLEKIFVEVFVKNGEIRNSVDFNKADIKRAMTLYAECEVKKLSKADVIKSVCVAQVRYEDCEIHKDNENGCLGCGNYKQTVL